MIFSSNLQLSRNYVYDNRVIIKVVKKKTLPSSDFCTSKLFTCRLYSLTLFRLSHWWARFHQLCGLGQVPTLPVPKFPPCENNTPISTHLLSFWAFKCDDDPFLSTWNKTWHTTSIPDMPFHQVNSGPLESLNMKKENQTMTVVEENSSEHFYNRGAEEEFLSILSEAETTKDY